jgi:hypothetical protein
MKKYYILLIVLAIIPGLLSADIFAKTGTAGLQFLKLGIDARAIGMAEAYTAVTDDISSVYWNPAGLAIKPNNQVMFSHTQYVAGIMHEYIAYSMYTDLGTFAFSGSALHMAAMDVHTEEQFEIPTGEKFYAGDFSAGISYANMFTDKFSFGFTAKYLRENLDEYSVNGYAVDMGSLYNTGFRNVTIGMSLRNFGPNLKYEIDDDHDGVFDEDLFDLLDNDGDGLIDEDREELAFKLPMNFSLGISGDLMREGNNALIASLQLDNCVDRRETYNLGAEYKFGSFNLRGGYSFLYDAQGLSAGFGVLIPTGFAVINLDYAYTDMGDLSESLIKSPHRLTLKLLF